MPAVVDDAAIELVECFESETPAKRFARQASVRVEAKTPEPPEEVVPLDPTVIGITDAILKSPKSLDRAVSASGDSSAMVMRLLFISVMGFVLFGVAMSLVFSSANMWPKLQPLKHALSTSLSQVMAFEALPDGAGKLAPWLNGRAFKLTLAYCLGLIGATGICLPSLYFYGLLAGVRMTMLDVVKHTLKAKATTAIALVGILPVYAAFALAVILFEANELSREFIFHLGLALPFIAGIAGCHSLYRGFGELPCHLPSVLHHQRRCFLRRMVLSWSVIFTAVSPVMIHEIWALLG